MFRYYQGFCKSKKANLAADVLCRSFGVHDCFLRVKQQSALHLQLARVCIPGFDRESILKHKDDGKLQKDRIESHRVEIIKRILADSEKDEVILDITNYTTYQHH